MPCKMLTIFHTWVCLCIWVRGVSASPVMPQNEEKEALVDNVNVLMYGVLQFSETLHDVHQNTEVKLARISRTITHTESLVQRLQQDTEQTIRSEHQIKDRLRVIQAEMAALRAQTQYTRGLVSRVEQEEAELKQKLITLEETLNILTPDSIRALKEMTQKHNRLLHDLVNWTEEQKVQLKNQNRKLAELQKRTSKRATTSGARSVRSTSHQ